MRRIHFISGLPRSGSTLLVALLKQNPAFQAGLTLATLRVLNAVESATSRETQASIMLNDDQKWALRRAVFEAIYEDYYDKVIFDKNHLWCAKLPLLSQLFPTSKMIVLVRDVSWIIDSFEHLCQSNPLEMQAAFSFKPNMTVYTRAARLSSSEGIVGAALDGLREAYYGPHRDRLLLIDYTDLVTNPAAEMRSIYKFINEPFFEHDFDHVSFSYPDFDTAVGLPGLHTVRGPVRFRPRKSILPPDLFNKFSNDAFWLLKQEIKLESPPSTRLESPPSTRLESPPSTRLEVA